ncbi:MAG: antitoxin [Pseudonocardiales bacterium]|nr:MAG: antitoxin [Pseudonocardiales bacterium]
MSLPEEDVEFLDAYVREQGYQSRSAAVHQAVAVLRSGQLAGAYEDAWRVWDASGEADAWDAIAADGVGAMVWRP